MEGKGLALIQTPGWVEIRRRLVTALYALHSIALVRTDSNNGRVTKRVMLVDDNPAILQALHKVFELHCDWAVCGEAVSGREGIEKAKILNPDLIVLDVSMPEMNGLEAARVLHGIMPQVPLILCSLHADEILGGEAKSAGAVAVVSKTHNMQTLVDKASELFPAS